MVQIKTTLCAIVVAFGLLSSTVIIGAAERESTTSATPTASQEQFRASLTQAIATVATLPAASGSTQTAKASQDQEPPQGRRSRRSEPCSCGIPSWIKYSLIGAAAAGGGYALSQVGHRGDGGERGMNGPDERR
jgi:hypothetical protein